MNSILSNRRPRRQRWLRILPLLALLLATTWLPSGGAMAAPNDCWIGGSTIAFGTVSGGGATTSATVNYTCNNDSAPAQRSYRLCMYINPNSGNNVDPRRLKHDWPVDYLNYDLYSDSAMSQLIGSTTSGHPVYSVTMTTTAKQSNGTMPIHGEIPSGQSVTAGNYYAYNTEVLRWVSQSGPTPPSVAQCMASASQTSNSSSVTANFADTCYISAATDMDFGVVANLATALNQTSVISLRCPTSTVYHLGLNNGMHGTGGTNRRMLGPGGNYLDYQLYKDSGHSSIWGEGFFTGMVGFATARSIETVTVYGQVPAQPIGSSGSYSDTVTITLTY